MNDLISRQAAIDALGEKPLVWDDLSDFDLGKAAQWSDDVDAIKALPSAQPPKEIPKRVLWSGWKGCRDTRYKCPNCEKPVRNDDAYCHRCGQRLMFPHISFTAYVPGAKQDVIVRWDDEG